MAIFRRIYRSLDRMRQFVPDGKSPEVFYRVSEREAITGSDIPKSFQEESVSELSDKG
mgnify:FL=1|jgi:hypothetical protein